MCRFASMILTRDRAFWSRGTDSHDEIIAEFGLVDEVAGRITLARIELTPPGEDSTAPLDQWVYVLDQDLLPEWYEPAETERRARVCLVEVCAARLFTTDEHQVTAGIYVACDSAQVTAYNSAQVTARDSAQVKAYGSATVLQWGGTVDLSDLAACVDRRGGNPVFRVASEGSTPR